MALLSSNEIDKIHAAMMEYDIPLGSLPGLSQLGVGDVNKTELRTYVVETDAWIDANQGSYNTSLSEPAKSNLTVKQKTIGLALVALRRAGVI